MSRRHKTYNGLVYWNHTKKEIHMTRRLNPLIHHAQFCRRLKEENPDYTLVEDWLK